MKPAFNIGQLVKHKNSPEKATDYRSVPDAIGLIIDLVVATPGDQWNDYYYKILFPEECRLANGDPYWGCTYFDKDWEEIK